MYRKFDFAISWWCCWLMCRIGCQNFANCCGDFVGLCPSLCFFKCNFYLFLCSQCRTWCCCCWCYIKTDTVRCLRKRSRSIFVSVSLLVDPFSLSLVHTRCEAAAPNAFPKSPQKCFRQRRRRGKCKKVFVIVVVGVAVVSSCCRCCCCCCCALHFNASLCAISAPSAAETLTKMSEQLKIYNVNYWSWCCHFPPLQTPHSHQHSALFAKHGNSSTWA